MHEIRYEYLAWDMRPVRVQRVYGQRLQSSIKLGRFNSLARLVSKTKFAATSTQILAYSMGDLRTVTVKSHFHSTTRAVCRWSTITDGVCLFEQALDPAGLIRLQPEFSSNCELASDATWTAPYFASSFYVGNFSMPIPARRIFERFVWHFTL
ncbi:hypothetical protein CROQUDRAFT_92448 [Cronartium quercuum f. sp. fusiforme G11]|uniref:Uncharacterized protein n=1 Tax=Cronartium quercuum f. sp. fusiforme G11 TaxID=708437 RepID=A0A9P6NNC2_9BASI|nr:hypothetical protein CROQUDRAFT_92448 [Cronartium quercuum f. sp. fusiforme G11]